MRSTAVCSALAGTILLLAPAIGHADIFILTNSNGGDGYATPVSGGYDLFGADNGVGGNTTDLFATSTSVKTVTYNYKYTTHDCCGSEYDPAGYYLNGVETQISPASSNPYETNTGSVTFDLTFGDSYGFYVSSTGIDSRPW